MNRVLIAVAGLVAFLSGASATWAFTTQPVNPEQAGTDDRNARYRGRLRWPM
jgi:hypothetical protein